MRNSKYYRKLFIYGVLISVLPIMTFGIFSYVNAREFIVQKAIQSERAALRQLYWNTESTIVNIDNTLSQAAYSTLTINAMLNSNVIMNYETYKSILALKNKADEMQHYLNTSYNLNTRVFFVNNHAGWYFYERGLHRYSENEKKIGDIVKLIGNSRITGSVLYSEGRIFITRPVFTFGNPVLGMFAVEMDAGGFIEGITDNLTVENCLIVDGAGQVVARISTEEYQDDDEFLSCAASAWANGISIFSYSGEKWHITATESGYGWTFIGLSPADKLNPELNYMALLIVAIGLTLFVVLCVITLFGSRWIYKPILKIYRLMKSDNPDEMRAIFDSIQNEIKARDALEASISKQSAQIREFFIKKLLLGKVTLDEINGFYADTGEFEYGRRLRICSVQIESYEGSAFSEYDKNLLLFALDNIIREILPKDILFETSIMDGYHVSLIKLGNDGEEAGTEAVSLFRGIVDTVLKYLSVKITVGVSSAFEEILNASLAFGESLEALQNPAEYGVTLFSESAGVTDMVFPEQKLSELINAVKSCNDGRIRASLHGFLDAVSGGGDRNYCRRHLLKSFLALADMRKQTSVLHNDALLSRFMDLKTREEYERWFLSDVIAPIVSVIERKGKNQTKAIVASVIEIIVREYDTPLTLEYCACAVSYHPDYVSRVFREQTGQSFSDYLAAYRIGQAKRMLIETDIRVQDISDRLCYSNAQNLIRVFKKHTGMTPGQFREIQQCQPRSASVSGMDDAATLPKNISGNDYPSQNAESMRHSGTCGRRCEPVVK